MGKEIVKANEARNSLLALVEKQGAAITAALPSHITPERMLRVARSAIQTTPGLWECSPQSVAASIVESSTLGLEPNGALGEAALVPFWNKRTKRRECQLMVMYRGYIELADRAGKSEFVDAQVVHEGDIFEFEYGSDQRLKHVPCLVSSKRGSPIAVYSLVKYKTGTVKFVVLSAEEVEAVRECSNAKDGDAWRQWWGEMAKKTALKRLFKYERLSPELSRATYLDDSIEGGVRPGETESVFEGDQQVEELKQRMAEAAAAGDPEEPETIEAEAEVVTEPPEETEPDPEPLSPFEPNPENADGSVSKFAAKIVQLRTEFFELAESAGLSEDEMNIKWRERVMKTLGGEGCSAMAEADQKQKNAIVKALAGAVKGYREALDNKEIG